MSIPSDLRYTDQHEWVDLNGDIATIGITQYAADSLGDIVFVGLPPIGSSLASGQPCGELESTKSVSDLMAPLDGDVVEINDAVVDDPSLLNSDAMDAWLVRLKFTAIPVLLDASTYAALVAAG
ncbi:glycine cleavage system protein GcvH [Nocardioides mangrovicus]|uniref:Glycine cleavage system H protein n=1 Tax=Nocardioides mangrovicus TaxID=2478913 RepID=A0A3L8P3R1_9ACTN|nr:glycine cleavage system protein GcvH [Nocardioides mangrovicus]RLV49741.1 glycine cleavage system protein GcvH [Nocardioides mangrovicus]